MSKIIFHIVVFSIVIFVLAGGIQADKFITCEDFSLGQTNSKICLQHNGGKCLFCQNSIINTRETKNTKAKTETSCLSHNSCDYYNFPEKYIEYNCSESKVNTCHHVLTEENNEVTKYFLAFAMSLGLTYIGLIMGVDYYRAQSAETNRFHSWTIFFGISCLALFGPCQLIWTFIVFFSDSLPDSEPVIVSAVELGILITIFFGLWIYSTIYEYCCNSNCNSCCCLRLNSTKRKYSDISQVDTSLQNQNDISQVEIQQ